MLITRICTAMIATFVLTCLLLADETIPDTTRGDHMIAEYFRLETDRLQKHCLADIKTLGEWNDRRETLRSNLLEMLGLLPLPERTDLKAQITARSQHKEFIVERLHFQSRPGLYVTGNLYVPQEVNEQLPAILYVCGHGRVKKGDVSFGNKAHYQHHGAWFARNGYVCLTIDTLQLGEIEGLHHGTYDHDMWWWFNHGYTPAGVEAWNCIRALDYLQSRKEVDPERIGVTGRSGGGAYSWWIAAIDERIQCAVPVAGITDLENHVVDGTVEGHCDCMFMVNTHQWDYATVAALIAPRPLLISNTDADGIFPLDGVYRTFTKTRRIYALHSASANIGLNITAGGHSDTQELRVPAFRWFNHFLKDDDSLIETTAEKFFEPEELKVFDELPQDEINTQIHDSFVRQAGPPSIPTDSTQWRQMRKEWRQALALKSFAAWPVEPCPLNTEIVYQQERDGVSLRAIDFTSQHAIRLRLYVVQRAGLTPPTLSVLNVVDEEQWSAFLATYGATFGDAFTKESLPPFDQEAFQQNQRMFSSFPWAMAFVAPRGIGPTAWNQTKRKQTQHQRRFYLLGQTLDGMRVYDTRRALQTLRTLEDQQDAALWLQSQGTMAGIALYASLFEPEIARLDLHHLPHSHREGPFFLNVSRFLDLPEAVALAAENSQVAIYDADPTAWDFPQSVVKSLGWEAKQLQIRKPLE